MTTANMDIDLSSSAKGASWIAGQLAYLDLATQVG